MLIDEEKNDQRLYDYDDEVQVLMSVRKRVKQKWKRKGCGQLIRHVSFNGKTSPIFLTIA